MSCAETVLGVFCSSHGRRGLPCEELYRQLFIRPLCLLTYRRTYANQGETTSGVSQETVDGI